MNKIKLHEVTYNGKKLLSFLERNDALGNYLEGVRIDSEKLNDLLTEKYEVRKAFYAKYIIWNYTKQGYQYWSDLSKGWGYERDKET